MLFFTRAHFVLVKGAPPAKGEFRAGNDPGFGYGEFAWPQIDNATPAEQAWNDAVYKQALQLASDGPAKPGATLEQAVDSSGYMYGYFLLHAVNGRLIDADFGISTYGWGAAHPLTATRSFLWSLPAQRQLLAEDIFTPDSKWQTALIAQTLAKLLKSPGPDGLWKSDDLNKAVASGATDLRTWDLSSEGLSITFGQYAVGPYALGSPTVTLPWNNLRTLLAPSFHPETLPHRLSAPNGL